MPCSKLLKRLPIPVLLLNYLSVLNAQVTADFSVPTNACVNSPLTIQNNTVGASTYYWSFCTPSSSKAPIVENLGNPGNLLGGPVFSDYVRDENGNYFVFVTNYTTGNLIRLAYGTSLLNTPTGTNLGNFNGILEPEGTEGIKIVYNENKWYLLIVGSNKFKNSDRLVKISFGASLTNPTPTATNWGNFAGFSFPHDLFIFKEGSSWYGYVLNKNSSTISKISFTSSFENVPIGSNIGNLGGLNYPTGIFATSQNGIWHFFITNSNEDPFGVNVGGGSITRIDFANGLLNTPSLATNMGDLNGTVNMPRDISIVQVCGKFIGFFVNQNTHNIIKLDFNNGITNSPLATSLGLLGDYSYPHSISKVLRSGSDLYFFVTDIFKNTLSRIKIEGCSNASVASSTDFTPPSIIFSTPGTYTVNLTVDEGLTTESSVCKEIILSGCVTPIILKNLQAIRAVNGTNVLSFETLDERDAITISIERAYQNMKFGTIGFVELKGDGKYIFNDGNYDRNEVYVFYRLKIVSKTAGAHYSEVKTLSNDKRRRSIELINNTFKGRITQLNVFSSELQQVQIDVFDGLGRLVLSQYENLVQGKNSIDVKNLIDISPGFYFIRFRSNFENKSFQVVVQ